MNFLEEFQYMAQRYPERAAIVDCNGERTTSYLELETLSRRIAAKLLQSGEISGRAVLVRMGRRMEYIAAEGIVHNMHSFTQGAIRNRKGGFSGYSAAGTV